MGLVSIIQGLIVKQVITLRAMENFECLGDRCSINCCAVNWRIPVDDKTFEKWQAQEDSEVRDYLLSTVEEVNGRLRTMKMNDSKRCVALNSEKLCGIN